MSVRALDAGVRDLLEQRIRELVRLQAESFGVQARIDYQRDYPVLVNDPAATQLAREVAIELVGVAQVVPQCPPFTGSEDFAVMLEHCPGSYLLIGNGDGHGEGSDGCMVHNPGYDFNDDNLAIGSAYWALLVERYLAAAGDDLTR